MGATARRTHGSLQATGDSEVEAEVDVDAADKEMNRSWMYGDRREREYQDGVREFCNAALEHQRLTKEPTIFCPCRDCDNGRRWFDISKIEEHLFRRGFTSDYETWYWHGEKLNFGDSNEHEDTETFPDEGNQYGDDDASMEEDRINDIHSHTLGQKSYSRKRADWTKEKRLPISSDYTSGESNSVVNDSPVQNRALEWCLAHQKRARDGKWEVNPNKSKTARIVDQVMEYIEKEDKEEEEGRTPSGSERGVDALTKNTGKKDHRGYVKGFGRFGVGVAHEKAFGKVARQGRRSTKSYKEVEALKASLTKEFELKLTKMNQEFELKLAKMNQEFEKRLKEHLKEQVAIEVQAAIASLLSSWNMPRSNLGMHTPPQEPLIIKEVRKCRLAVHDEENKGNLVIVAEGRVHPILGGVVHNSSLTPGHYRVSIDSPYEEHSLVSLPVPLTDDGVTKLGEAKDYFVQWPMSLVLFEDKMPLFGRKPWSQSKERVSSCNSRIEDSDASFKKMKIDSGNIHIENLGEKCELLLMVMVDENHDTIKVVLKAPLFYLEEDKAIWVTSTDIS